MSATTNVQVVLNAKDNASATLKRFGNNVAGISTRSSENLRQLGADFKRVGMLSMALGAGFVAFGVKAGMSAARIEELGFALHAIAKANGVAQEAADKTVASLRGMNIAHKQALQVTALFIQSQLKLADATKIATAAKDLAVVAGMDSSEATQLLTQAIVMQRPMLLRQFGIVKGLDQIYGEYADKNKLVATSLTEAQKKQAFLNAVLEQGKRTAGAYDAAMHSVSKRFRSLTGRIIPDFIAQVGEAFKPALTVVINSITNSIEKMSKWIDQNKDAIADWGKKIGYATKVAVDAFGKLVKFLINNKEIVEAVLIVMAGSVVALAGAFVYAHLLIIGAMTAIVAAITVFLKAWEPVTIFFTDMWTTITATFTNALNSLLEIVTNVWITIVDTVQTAIETLDTFYEEHKTVINSVVMVITALFLPAIIELGVQMAITGTIIATQFIVNVVRAGVEALITNGILATEFIVNIVILGAQSAVTGAIMATSLIANVIRLGVQAGITATVGLWNLILNTIKWGLEGWKLIAMLIVKIVKLGIATVAITLHTAATIAQTVATVGLTAMTWLLNAALAVLTSPILAVVAAIGVLIAIGWVLYKNWNTIRRQAVEVWDSIKRKIGSVINWIRNLINNFHPVIHIGLHLPDVVGAWRSLKERAHNLRIPGFQTGGIVPGPIGAPVPIIAHGGEKVTPVGISEANGGGGGSVTFNVSVGLYAGTETEKRNIAQELYGALLQLAQSQNKNVMEFMGG